MGSDTLPLLRSLIPAGSRVVCAVSGGADSVCLLHLLWTNRQALGFTLSAAHYNHRLRGKESDRDQAFVTRLCQEWAIPLTVGSGDVKARQKAAGESLEQAARTLRYAFLETAAGPDALIATAHTADDNLETVLINLLRGTGLAGLSGIPQSREQFIRPLLLWTRQDVLSYLEANDLPHVEDSSNRSDDYLRNRLRHQVLPRLKAENPDLAHTVLQTTTLLRQDGEYLDTMAREALDPLQAADGSLTLPGLLALDPALRGRAVLFWLRNMGVDALGVHVRAVLQLAQGEDPSGTLSLPGGKTLRRVYDRLELADGASVAALPPTVLTLPGKTVLPGLTVLCQWAEGLFSQDPGILYLDLEALTGPLVLRSRLAGDVLQTPGGRKRLKKLFIDEKIPAHLRDTVPVLADDTGPIAVLIQNRWLGCPRRGELCLQIIKTK